MKNKALVVLFCLIFVGIVYAQPPSNIGSESILNKVYDSSDDTLKMKLQSTVVGTEVSSDITAPTRMITGQTTVSASGTPVVLSGDEVVLGVTIRANGGNVNVIYVGTALDFVTTDAYIVAMSEDISIAIDNLNKIYIDADADNDGVSFIAVGQ